MNFRGDRYLKGVGSGALGSDAQQLGESSLFAATRRHWLSLIFAVKWPLFLAGILVFSIYYEHSRYTLANTLVTLVFGTLFAVWIAVKSYRWLQTVYVLTDRRALERKIPGSIRPLGDLSKVVDIATYSDPPLAASFGMCTVVLVFEANKQEFPDSPAWWMDAVSEAVKRSKKLAQQELGGGLGQTSPDTGSAWSPPIPGKRSRPKGGT